MTDGCMEDKPARVPLSHVRVPRAMQVGEIHSRWEWVEPCVWTERMLTALEKGVKGGTWFSLVDKVFALPTLRQAFGRVKANQGAAGVDHQTIEMFEQDLEANLQMLAEELGERRYLPKPVRRKWIPKPGKAKELRPLGIPTVRDRIVQTALRSVLEPIFEREFAAQSYGFRPKRGCKDALRRVEELLRTDYTYVVDADLKSYFDTIPHGPLMERMRERVADGRVLELIEAFLKQGVTEGLAHWTPEAGSPQGAVISPLLSNVYLNPLDHYMVQEGFEMVRYADDFVILCRSETQAQRALVLLREWTAQAGLQLHPEKTRIVDLQGQAGFDFLGYHFERDRKWPRDKSLAKIKDAIRGQTQRTNGNSLQATITRINPKLRGWFGYFKHSHKFTFAALDGWVRMRLRSILRRRLKRRGRGRGKDHQRWTNAYFAQHGLYSMEQAHAELCQSLTR